MIRKAYKVVQHTYDDKRVSCCATGASQVEYKVGEFVQAPEWLREMGYDIAVFFDLDSAMDYMEDFPDGDEVWEVEVEGAMNYPLLPILCWHSLRNGDLLEREQREFYRFQKLPREAKQTYAEEWPIGTYLAEKVKLVALVYSRKNGWEE